MATTTYVPIQTYTVSGSPTATITFGSGGTLPQSYTDLVLIANSLSTANTACALNFNGDFGSNYSDTVLDGDGSSAFSFRRSNQSQVQDILARTDNVANIINIMNYSNSSTYKTILSRSNSVGGSELNASVNLWRSTSPITSITITAPGTTFKVGASFTLYGIASAPDWAAKATGGTITHDINYTYHTFTSSGTFTPSVDLNADVLVIAGGGGTTNANAGGGGAGGIAYAASYSLTGSTGYGCVVGSGGPSGSTSNGGNSTFGSTLITALGGGYGAEEGNSGANGGSGGGAAGKGGGTTTPGSATQTSGTGYIGYGNNGGAAWTNDYIAGGGGGAGAAGANATSSNAGNGGVGLATWSSWGAITSTGQNVGGTYYYAGGGGGGSDHSTNGSGGYGGGGGFRTNGTVNTGGGAGGSGGTGARGGANGGSGLIIVRYAN